MVSSILLSLDEERFFGSLILAVFDRFSSLLVRKKCNHYVKSSVLFYFNLRFKRANLEMVKELPIKATFSYDLNSLKGDYSNVKDCDQQIAL